jgi:uracil-DNA glycosylase family 4
VLLWGESPAVDEQISGVPFTGAAGSMLTRCLRLIGKTREQVRVDNVVRGTFLAPLEAHPEAVRGCQYRNDVLAQAPPQVLVPMGAVALREALGLTGTKGVRVQDFHGTVTRDPTNRFWVVPTYHPSHLQRGATNLMGTVAFDLRRAFDVARDGWAPDPGRLVIDPPVEWFRAWVELAVAARHQSPDAFPLAVDIETPDKATDEGDFYGKADEGSWQIKRVNVSVDPDEGVTVPFEGAYITLLMHLLAGPGVQYYWFKGFDVPRLVKAGAPIQPEEAYDLMWTWKALQSDLPGGLGFAAPFYSTWGAWKHLAETDEARYGAIDGLQTRRVGDGVVGDLVKEGRWDVFKRHQHDFHRLVLQPATDVGVPIDRARLLAFKATLDTEATRLIDTIAALAPPEVTPLTPKLGLTRPPASILYTKANAFKRDGTPKKEAPDPVKAALYTRARVVESLVLREVVCCTTCGAKEVAKTHRCQRPLFDGAPDVAPSLSKQVATVRRWFWQEPFNPDSPQQLMAYVLAKGHTPGKAKATGNDSVDRETLSRLIRETEDPFYQAILDYRAVGKVRSTYVIGTEKRLDADDRVHPTFSFKPSTMRLSAQNPNIQNVVHGDDEGKSLASGYRLCVVAKRSSWMMEFDYSAIESVVSGWCMRDPRFIRYAKLGVHAIVASHSLGRPADLTQPDREIAAYLKSLKTSHEPAVQIAYKRSKRVVHGTTYGMTTHGMMRNYPTTFPTVKSAEAIRAVYFTLAPGVPLFQTAVHATAHETHHLGGPPPYVYDLTTRRVSGHPFGYQHWFWSVVSYERLTVSQRLWREKRGLPTIEINGIWYGVALGEDAKRGSAFYGQSIARGVLTEACFPLFDPADVMTDGAYYIGDAYYGETPLRAPIHDSLLLEVPTGSVERVAEKVIGAMSLPIQALPCPAEWGMGDYLTIGVDAKIGPDWGTMTSLTRDVSVAADARAVSDEAEDEDDVLDLETRTA